MTRQHPADQRDAILTAAKTLARKGYLYSMTSVSIASHAGITRSLIWHYFDTLEMLRAEVIRYAVREGVVSILAQALACNDPLVHDITDEQKAVVAEYMKGT